ncbi:FAD/NAD(P)-binding domain-containing protein, partial [Aureobasidium melanogenum]
MEKVDTLQVVDLDALIVGAGFGGVYQLKKLYDLGYDVKLVESGTDFGGVWYWNRYPGARVDIPIPHYEFSDPKLWEGWTWKQRFPGSAELRAYFGFVADTWNIRDHCVFSSYVNSAIWDEEHAKWIVKIKGGLTYRATFFLPNTGFAAKRYIPDWKGLEGFKGTWVHPSFWPAEGIDLEGKRIAVIGTGSTGVQLSQELAPLASEFVLFQRTPNLALPMKQQEFDGKGQTLPKEQYPDLYAGRKLSFGGIDYSFSAQRTFDHTPEERRAVYETLWAHGDFHFWLAAYGDMLFSDEANTEAYNVWRDKVRARLDSPRLKDKFAPMKKPHAFGCKRVSLENGFYELFNRSNVHLVDMNETPVVEITPNGIKTSEKEWDFDLVVCATGFDAVTGGILDMNVQGRGGTPLRDFWRDGVKTNFGMCVPSIPNMFFTYGPQAPTALCNGPSCAELQGDWIVDVLEHVRKNNYHSIDASEQASKVWAEGVAAIANMSLLPTTRSWYMGDNIPGKRRECLIYLGGVPTYYKLLNECAANNYEGFVIA